MKIPQIMFKYLRFALDGAGVDVNIKQFDEEILRGLYFLSQKHDLSHLIADVLDKQKVWTSDSELKRRFLDDRDTSVFRYEQINYEYQEIITLSVCCGCGTFMPEDSAGRGGGILHN